MKKLITIIFALACICGYGQSVQWRNLNTSQFGSNLFLVSIKRGAPLTNPVVRGSFTNDQGTGAYFTDGNGLLKGQVTPYTGPNIPGLQLHASDVKVLELLTNLVSVSQNAVFAGTITGNGSGLTNFLGKTNYIGNIMAITGPLGNIVTVNTNGRVRFGNEDTATMTEAFEFDRTETNAPNGNSYGLRSFYTLNFYTNEPSWFAGELGEARVHPSSTASVNVVRGNYGYVRGDGSGIITNAMSHFGVVSAGTNKIINAIGFDSVPHIATGSMTNLYHFRVNDVVEDAAGAGYVGTQYGLYVPNFTRGVVENIPIYSASTGTVTFLGGQDIRSNGLFRAGIRLLNNQSIQWAASGGAFTDVIKKTSADNVEIRNSTAGGDLYIGTPAASTTIQLKAAGNIIFGGALTSSSSLSAATSITASNLFQLPTNYTAANFVPTAGLVKIVSSNGALFSVTQLSTNLIAGP